ncbi:uncharacterized protein TNCV_1632031 [Trichonephila clavipes]|nr:uncharacterized protein TNCV_1632031 [Trichonephila clavipes]
MDVCKCIVPSLQGGILNSHRAASPLMRLVVDERWEVPDPPPGCSASKLGRTELNRTVPCMVLEAKANDRRTSSPLP